jgi:hypothetical protein
MIHRKFDSLKFKRTYIGGSKKNESKAFTDVQGTKEDNSECDWMEYRRILTQYLDDVLHVLLSWKYVTKLLSIVFGLIAMFALCYSLPISVTILSISLIVFLLSKYLGNREKLILMSYDFSLDIVLKEINSQTGFNLSKN